MREGDPELGLLPDAAGVGAKGRLDLLALSPSVFPQHRLAKSDPGPRVGLLAHQVVTLGAEARGEHVVGPLSRLRPDGGERHVTADAFGVLEHLDPRAAVGIGPDGVVDAREVDVDALVLVPQQVRQQEAHLVVREGILARPDGLVPARVRGRLLTRLWHELVPGVGVQTAGRADAAREHVQEEQRARHLPPAQVTAGGAAPQVAREGAAGGVDLVRELSDDVSRDAALLGGELARVAGIGLEQLLDQAFEAPVALGVLGGQKGLPVGPAAQEVGVETPRGEQLAGNGEQQRSLRARPGRHPDVRARGSVRQARVHNRQARPRAARVHDALGVGIEVVPGLEMSRDQQHELRARVVRRGAIGPEPQGVAQARAGAADVRVAVVAVDAPGLQHAQDEVVVAGTADVVHDLVVTLLVEGGADTPADVVEGLFPGDGLELARTPRPAALEGLEDALAVAHLVDGGRPLGAGAPAAAGVHGVALELLDLTGRLVHKTEQAARGLTVEADRRNARKVAFVALGPGARVQLDPVIPEFGRRADGQLPG